MTRLRHRIALGSIVAASALTLVLFFANPALQRDPKRPAQLPALAQWIAEHPADWLAASAITDQSLDSPLALQRRVALWHSSYALARYLAPLRPNPTAGFVRAGLFHWYELGPADRKAVLDAATPMLQDPLTFEAMHRPLWELTRDLAYLRRVAPRTIPTFTMLRDLAVASGDFAKYRELREDLREARMAEFHAKRATATIGALIAILPPTLTTDDEPLVRAILQEIERRPFDVESMGGRLEDFTLYAIRHGLQPLSALSSLVEINGKLTPSTRARLAIALGDRAAAMRIELITGVTNTPEWIPYHLERAAFEEKNNDPALAALYRTRATVPDAPPENVWTGPCSVNELCTSLHRTHSGPLTFQVSVTQSDEIPPYVEVYLDDALVAEGEVHDQRTFTINASPEKHRTEVRLVNRFTKNGTQRRARLS